MPKNDPLPPPVNTLHGRRKGKKLRSFQHSLMQDLLPKLSVDVSQPIAAPCALFADKPGELWLEIGFGGGEHLAANASQHPQVGFFGCEPFENGIA
ncbi:MAG: tRNA (guanosine(46)-N7)-methyltransferase TrmB, partial [Hyphomicrobiales bacterium]|nr:tRNA (guanosine(46)-N7)-methyltransferase TrmB [Hyphomicrobiales bacterium]